MKDICAHGVSDENLTCQVTLQPHEESITVEVIPLEESHPEETDLDKEGPRGEAKERLNKFD